MKRTWITEISVLLGIVGGGLLAGAQLIPDPGQGSILVVGDPVMNTKLWMQVIGTVLMSIGGGGGIYRISKKAGQGPTQP
jgi:hypothetical protein